MFSTGMGPIPVTFFSLATMLIPIPTGVKIFNSISAIVGATAPVQDADALALGFIAMFIIGGLSGVMHASPPADLQQTDTYFVVAPSTETTTTFCSSYCFVIFILKRAASRTKTVRRLQRTERLRPLCFVGNDFINHHPSSSSH